MDMGNVWTVIADAGLRSAVLCAGGLLVAGGVMRRSSAARRHVVYAGVLIACLLLPVLSLLLPQWRVLPQWPVSAAASAPAPIVQPTLTTEFLPVPDATTISPSPNLPLPPSIAPSPSALPPSPAWYTRLTLTQWLMLAWLAGVVMFSLPIFLGQIAILRIRRSARPMHDALLSPNCRMPMACGLIRPAVILPEEAYAWPPGRREAVVRHELEHLRRRDCLWQQLGQFARALYWFNPLVWVAYHRMLCEAERACDDAVLAHGSKPSDYAEHLLAVATTGRSDLLLASAGVAMARSTSLEGRLLSILDAARSRRAVTKGLVCLSIAVLLGTGAPLAMLRAADRERDRSAPAAATQPTRRVVDILDWIEFGDQDQLPSVLFVGLPVAHPPARFVYEQTLASREPAPEPVSIPYSAFIGRLNGAYTTQGSLEIAEQFIEGNTLTIHLRYIRDDADVSKSLNVRVEGRNPAKSVYLWGRSLPKLPAGSYRLQVTLSEYTRQDGKLQEVHGPSAHSEQLACAFTLPLPQTIQAGVVTPVSSASAGLPASIVDAARHPADELDLRPRPTNQAQSTPGNLTVWGPASGNGAGTGPTITGRIFVSSMPSGQISVSPAPTLAFWVPVTVGDREPYVTREQADQLISRCQQLGPATLGQPSDLMLWIELPEVIAKESPGLVYAVYSGHTFILVSSKPEHRMMRYSQRPWWRLTSIRRTTSDVGQPAVAFTFDDEGSRQFGDFTARHLGQKIAAAVGTRLVSIATVQSRIERSGIIASSTMTEAAADELVDTLTRQMRLEEQIDKAAASSPATAPATTAVAPKMLQVAPAEREPSNATQNATSTTKSSDPPLDMVLEKTAAMARAKALQKEADVKRKEGKVAEAAIADKQREAAEAEAALWDARIKQAATRPSELRIIFGQGNIILANGQPITWGELPRLLETNPPGTVALTMATVSDDMPLFVYRHAQYALIDLVNKHKLSSFSDTGKASEQEIAAYQRAVAARPATDPANAISIIPDPGTSLTRPGEFRVVFGDGNTILANGKPTTWGELPKLLEANPPGNVPLSMAVVSDDIPLHVFRQAKGVLLNLVSKYKLASLSDTGKALEVEIALYKAIAVYTPAAATSRPATDAANGVSLTLKADASLADARVYQLAPGDRPILNWSLAPEVRAADYLGLIVVPCERPDLANLPQSKLWQAGNNPDKWAWGVMNLRPPTNSAAYGQQWDKAQQITVWHQPEDLETGYYAVMLMAYRGKFVPQEGRQPVARAFAVLKVGNPPEPQKPDYSKLTPEQMQAKVQEWVEDFFTGNFRDVTARKTIEWGKLQKLDNGNWQIRYKYEAEIWHKDKITQDKLFTFTPEGGFVSVQDASRPASATPANLPPMAHREVNKPLSDFADKPDLSTPELAWATWQRAMIRMDAKAVVDLSWIRIPVEDEADFFDRLKRDPDQVANFTQSRSASKLIEVWIDRDELAYVICYESSPARQDRHPFHIRNLGRIAGQWKNLGEDAYPTLEATRQSIPERRAAAWNVWRQTASAAAPVAPAQPAKPVTAADRAKADELAKEGWTLWQQQQFAPASDRFAEAVKLNPNATNAWNGLGWALFNSGRTDEARDAFTKCIALARNHPAALNGLGQVELQQGDLANAEKHLLASAPTSSAAWWGLAKVYLIQGKYDEAAKWTDRILKDDPSNADAQMLKAAAQQKRLPDVLKDLKIKWEENGKAAGSNSPAFEHVVLFEPDEIGFLEGDHVLIKEIRGTAATITPGNTYQITGTYVLKSHDRARIGAFTTAADPAEGSGPMAKDQMVTIDKGEGTFTLTMPIKIKGRPHVSFYPDKPGGSFGGVYLNTPQTAQ